jgi:hypothetical protein
VIFAKRKVTLRYNVHVQSNLTTTAALGTPKNGRCTKVVVIRSNMNSNTVN